VVANLNKLKDLLASLDPEETRQLLASARPQEQWTGCGSGRRPAARSRRRVTPNH